MSMWETRDLRIQKMVGSLWNPELQARLQRIHQYLARQPLRATCQDRYRFGFDKPEGKRDIRVLMAGGAAAQRQCTS